MKTTRQNFTKIEERLSFGVKLCRALLILLLISLMANIGLTIQLCKANAKLQNSTPLIMSTGTMEQVGENSFRIIPDEDIDTFDLPSVPQHLK